MCIVPVSLVLPLLFPMPCVLSLPGVVFAVPSFPLLISTSSLSLWPTKLF